MGSKKVNWQINNFVFSDKCRIFVDKCQCMKKTTKSYAIKDSTTASLANEPFVNFIAATPLFTNKKPVAVKSFTYKHFKKIADKIDFSLQDWAALLFISERTLQRYAKANSEFNGLQIERILYLEKLIDAGNELFGANFANWLKQPSVKYNGDTPYSKLFSHDGIINVLKYIGQLEWGIFA
jgi:hypothetical protein